MKVLTFFCFAVLFAACGPTYTDVTPQPTGWRAPDLSAPDQWERNVSLKANTTGPWAVVFFYPKADTPG